MLATKFIMSDGKIVRPWEIAKTELSFGNAVIFTNEAPPIHKVRSQKY